MFVCLIHKPNLNFLVICDSNDESLLIQPRWILQEVSCMEDMYNLDKFVSFLANELGALFCIRDHP